MSEGQEVRADASVEPLCSFQQAHLAPGHQLLHLELGVELLTHLGRQRPNVGAVLLQDLRLGFGERQRPLLLLLGFGPQALERLGQARIVFELLDDLLGEVF